MALELYMVGAIVEDMPRAVEFYRRLGVDVPQDAEGEEHVEMKMSGLTFFLSTKRANARWDPARTDAAGGYRIVLEFYLETPSALDAIRGADRFRIRRALRAVRRHPEAALRDGRRPGRQHDSSLSLFRRRPSGRRRLSF